MATLVPKVRAGPPSQDVVATSLGQQGGRRVNKFRWSGRLFLNVCGSAVSLFLLRPRRSLLHVLLLGVVRVSPSCHLTVSWSHKQSCKQHTSSLCRQPGWTRQRPRHAELAVAELGLGAARPQTSPDGAKPNAPLDHEELDLNGQKANHCVPARLAYLAVDRLDIAVRRKECSRESNTCKPHTLEAYWTILAPRAPSRVGVPTARRGEHRDYRWTLRRRRGLIHQNTTVNIWRPLCAWDNTPWQLGRPHNKVLSLSSAESEYCSMVGCASGSWTRGSCANLDRRSSSTRAGLPQREDGAIKHQGTLVAVAQRQTKISGSRRSAAGSIL